MTKTANIATEASRLAAEAAQAQARASAAQSAADEAARLAEERHQTALAAIRRRRLDAYDDAALVAEKRAGAERFRQAIEDGKPGIVEFVAWQEVVSRHYMMAVEAASISATLEPGSPRLPTPGVAGASYADEVQRVVASIVAGRTADFEDARQAEFDAAGR